MKSKQTILPILALVASIAIMTLPTAFADAYEDRIIVKLELLIVQYENSIDNIQAYIDTLQGVIDRIEATDAEYYADRDIQAIIDRNQEVIVESKLGIAALYAIITSGGELTDEQEQEYADYLTRTNVNQYKIAYASELMSLLEDGMAWDEAIDEAVVVLLNQISDHILKIDSYEDAIAYLQSMIDRLIKGEMRIDL